MITYELWRERGTGAVWAVELQEEVVVGARGPLEAREVDEALLPGFHYSRDRAGWIDTNRDEFEPYDATSPYAGE